MLKHTVNSFAHKYYIAIIFRLAIAFILLSSSQAFSAGIIIDPGHSPKREGAIGCSGKAEYLYNAELASKIAAHLESLGLDVSLTKEGNSELSLSARARKSKGKDLFLSIHHDSVQRRFIHANPGKGVCSNKAAGFSIFVSRLNHHVKESLDYANKLGDALAKQGLSPTLHHAEKIRGENRPLYNADLGIYFFDNLAVLKRATSPAILLEVAVIVHPEDEKRAASDAYQRIVVESVGKMFESRHVKVQRSEQLKAE